jgi:hypothetical protein
MNIKRITKLINDMPNGATKAQFKRDLLGNEFNTIKELPMTKRQPYTHSAKCHIEYYHDILSRRVDYDLRKDDRPPPYEVGDTIILHEHSVVKDAPMGNQCRVVIVSAKRSRLGLKAGYVALGLKLIGGKPLVKIDAHGMRGMGE